MTAFKKIAVSIPAETYRALETARDELGKTRSEVVAVAVKEWLRGLEAGEQRRRYVDGYLRLPERVGAETVAVVAAATADWSSWEAGEPSRAREPRARGRKR